VNVKEKAHDVACDACGVPFSVGIDEPDVPPNGWSMFDIAVDV
jgi:hypothetical protein